MQEQTWPAAAALELSLGDPRNPRSALNFASSSALDEHDAYPEGACQALNDWGLARYYVPLSDGGLLSGHDELLALLRVLARRDLTVAIAHGKTFLGSVCAWVAGSPEQRARLAAIILSNQQVALGLTERDHGSDLLSGEVAAASSGSGYLVSGEKWLVNNATRGRAMTLLAKTDPAGGSRAFSLFLVDKQALPSSSFRHLPKITTHGIRGADISGIHFENVPLSSEALIGAAGSGLEITLKSLQITRTMCAGLSLGALEACLRTTLRFALGRRLYGDLIVALPFVRESLGQVFLDLLGAEALSVAATRMLHVAPQQMSVTSAVVKYLVPTLSEDALRQLSVVLGARYYLRETFEWGMFQKMARDNAIVSLFDGSTVVNLQALGLQLPSLCSERRAEAPEEVEKVLNGVFRLAHALPHFEPKNLALTNRGRNDWLSGLGLVPSGEPDTTTTRCFSALARELVAFRARLSRAQARHGTSFAKSPELFRLAKAYAALQAAAACWHMWRFNQDTSEFFRTSDWAPLWIDRLLVSHGEAGFLTADERESRQERVTSELLRLYDEGLSFSLFPVPLAPSTAS